jgi:hypothetical protein
MLGDFAKTRIFLLNLSPAILVHRRSFGNILALETKARPILLAPIPKIERALQRGGI